LVAKFAIKKQEGGSKILQCWLPTGTPERSVVEPEPEPEPLKP